MKKSSKKIIRSLSTRNRRGQREKYEQEPVIQNSNSTKSNSNDSKNHNITIKKDITLKKEEKIQIKYKNMKTDDYKNNPSGSNCSENRSLAVIKHLKIPNIPKNSHQNQKNKNNAKISSTNKSNNKSPKFKFKSNSFIFDNYDNQSRESEENREQNILKPQKKSKSIELQHKLLKKLNLSENWKLDDKISNDFEVIESNEDEAENDENIETIENEQITDDGNRNQKFETFLIELGSVDDLQDQQKLKRVDQVFVDDFYGELKHKEQNQLITRKLNSSGSDQLLEEGEKTNINHSISIEEVEANQYDSIVVHEQEHHQKSKNNNIIATDPTTTQKPDTTLIPPAVNKIIIKKVDNSRKLTVTDKKNNNSNKQIQQIQQIQPQFKINYNFKNKDDDVHQFDDSTSPVNKKLPVKPSNSFEPFKITEDQAQIISESFICRICEKRIESYGANDNKSDSESTNNQNTESSKTNFICSDCLAHNKNNNHNIDGRVRRRVKKIEKLEHHHNSENKVVSSSKFIGFGFEVFQRYFCCLSFTFLIFPAIFCFSLQIKHPLNFSLVNSKLQP